MLSFKYMNIDNSITKIRELYKDSDEEIKGAILKYLNSDIFKKLETFKVNLNEKNKLLKLSEEYINNFLINSSKRYFYIAKSNTFVSYDNIDFKVESETNIVHNILIQITKNKQLKPWKYKIKNIIIKEIKSTELFKIIPESITIQKIVKFFTERLLPNKDLSKYFLTILGDIILQKDLSRNYLINDNGKKLINILNEEIQQFLKNKNAVNYLFKYNINPEQYESSRILFFDTYVDNSELWHSFIKENIINIILVAVYYSNRYQNAENFIGLSISPRIKEDVLKLTIKSENEIMDYFLENYTQPDNEKGNISLKDMKYIWLIFLKKNKLPNLINLNCLSTKFQSKLSFVKNYFCGIKSNYLEIINNLNNFWNDSIVYNIKEDIEVSEICDIYNKTSEVLSNSTFFIDENEFKIYLDVYHNIQVKNKYIYGYYYKNWDKVKETTEIITKLKLKYKNTPILFEKSIDMIYTDYCEESKLLKNLIVGKKWFEKYIIQIIPEKYIIKKRILNEYWQK